jgi:O-antigen/teichoic acid export membrane protein
MDLEKLIRQVARNSGFSALGFLVVTGLVFIVTPYTLHRLGPAGFGIWALGGVMNAYAQLADFGISRALVKYIAEYDARKDSVKLNEVVNTGLILYVGLALGGGAILLPFRSVFIGPLFRIPTELQQEAWFVFTGLILIAMWTLVFSVFESLLNGLQRLDLTNTLATTMQIFSAVGVFIALESGFGLRGLVVKNAVIAGLTSVVYLYMMRRVLPGLHLDWRLFQPARARELLRFGSNIQIVNVVVLLLEPLNKILLSRFLSLNAVAYYEIGTNVVRQVVNLFHALIFAIYPTASGIHATQGHRAVAQMYVRSTRYMAILALPVFSLLILLAEPFIRAWIGPGYQPAAVTVQLLAMARFFSILGMPAYFIAQGIGQPRLSTLSSVYTGVSGLLLSIGMLLMFGYYGLVVGNAIALATGSLLMLLLFHRATRLSWRKLLESLSGRAIIANLVIAGLTVLILMRFRPAQLSMLLLWSIVYLLLYSLGLFALGAFDAEERRMLQRLMPGSWANLQERTPPL